MAKWIPFNGDGSALTPGQQGMLGYAFRKIRPDLFELNTDQQVFDAVCAMIVSKLLTLKFKIRANGSVDLKFQTRIPQASDARKLAEAQEIGSQAHKAKPIGAPDVE
jgi:hypothetical protein